MATITTRSGKGSALTHTELDNNFSNLNSDKVEASGDTITGNLNFQDNAKAIFGTGSDLQIYHDGTNSYIVENGTGNLNINANRFVVTTGTPDFEYMIQGVPNADVRLYYNGDQKIATTSTGVDVTGTVTATDSGTKHVTISNTSLGSFASPKFTDVLFKGFNSSDKARIRGVDETGNTFGGRLLFETSDAFSNDQSTLKTRIGVDRNGDISFYEDTGTTAKLFWDASAESLGIGTTSPGSALEVVGRIATSGGSADIQSNLFGAGDGSATNPSIRNIGDSDTGFWFPAANTIGFSTAGTEAMRINSSGNVGIGTDSPGSILDISAGTNLNAAFTQLSMDNFTNDGIGITFSRTSSDADLSALGIVDTDKLGLFSRQGLIFGTGGSNAYGQVTEAMRIDSSGNLLVGKTSAAVGTDGAQFLPSGYSGVSATSNTAFFANRNSTNGTVIEVGLNGGNIGSIGTSTGGGMFIGSGDTGLNFRGDLDAIYPWGPTGGARADVIDLGYSTVPFKDLYLSGGAYLGGIAAANKLDDYEEGTWTPAIAAASGAFTTLTYSLQHGTYTKIGNTVRLTCVIATSEVSVGTASGAITITGNPFAFSAASNAPASGYIGTAIRFATDMPNLRAYGSNGLYSLALQKGATNTTGNFALVDVTDLTTGATTYRNYLSLTFVFQTA